MDLYLTHLQFGLFHYVIDRLIAILSLYNSHTHEWEDAIGNRIREKVGEGHLQDHLPLDWHLKNQEYLLQYLVPPEQGYGINGKFTDVFYS